MRAWRRASSDLQVHGALPVEQRVLLDDPFMQRTDRVHVEARFDAEFPESPREPAGVPVPFEQSAAHDTRHFIDAISEKEAAFVNRQLRFVPRKKLTVQVNNRHLRSQLKSKTTKHLNTGVTGVTEACIRFTSPETRVAPVTPVTPVLKCFQERKYAPGALEAPWQ